MRILAVTPMLPHEKAVSAGPVVMYHSLAAIAARHETTLATFAGPDPAESEALQGLRALGIEVHGVWRAAPSRIMRRWKLLSAFAPVPDPDEWSVDAATPSPGRDLRALRSSPIRRGERRLQQAWYWLTGAYPLRTLQFWEPEMQQVLGQLLAEKRFDLIHIEDNAMASYRYDSGLPHVLVEHEVHRRATQQSQLWEASWFRRTLRDQEARRWEGYQRAVWQSSDRIQVFTTGDAEAVRSLAPQLAERVRVNSFGIQPQQMADPRREESGTVVFVGGFGHLPNVDAALWLGNEIMPRLRTLHPGVRLTVVGSYPPNEVRGLSTEDIIVTGRVPTVEPYLEQASVVLAPMRLGGGMRFKVLQAMALGKVVVTTPLGVEGLAVSGDEPPLVVGTDADELARRTAELLASDAERRALGVRARDFVMRHHTWSAYADRLNAMYAELVDDEAASDVSRS